MTEAVLLSLLLNAGFAAPQAGAVLAYAAIESRLDPCASSRLGDGLFGVTGDLRRTEHREAGAAGCVAPEFQVGFMARQWPRRYPECARRFAAGDLAAFRRCWGKGRRR